MPQVDGLYRLCYGSEIIPCSYDFETCKLGELSFVSPIPYLHEYMISRAKPPRHLLYQALLDRKDAVGVYITSNTYIMTVLSNGIIASHWAEDDVELYTAKIHVPNRRLLPIGYVKTRPECKDVTITPYKLYYDVDSKLAFHNMMWFKLDENPTGVNDVSLYKELISTDKECIYQTISGERRFL